MMPAGQRSITHYFNPNNVHVPTDVSHPYGNAGAQYRPQQQRSTISISASTSNFGCRGKAARLEFRTEVFNALNKTNFQAADRGWVELLVRRDQQRASRPASPVRAASCCSNFKGEST